MIARPKELQPCGGVDPGIREREGGMRDLSTFSLPLVASQNNCTAVRATSDGESEE